MIQYNIKLAKITIAIICHKLIPFCIPQLLIILVLFCLFSPVISLEDEEICDIDGLGVLELFSKITIVILSLQPFFVLFIYRVTLLYLVTLLNRVTSLYRVTL